MGCSSSTDSDVAYMNVDNFTIKLKYQDNEAKQQHTQLMDIINAMIAEASLLNEESTISQQYA